eukprot:gene1882-1023_t
MHRTSNYLEKRREDYNVKFESIFHEDIMKNNFKQFLKAEKNVASFEFLLAVESFHNTKEDTSKLDLFKNIVNNFISKDSKQKICCEEKLKSRFLEKYSHQLLQNEKWVLESENIFGRLEASVYKYLHFIIFPRFIRSESFIEIFEEHQNNLDIFTQRTKEFEVSEKNFEVGSIINSDDIEFFHQLVKDDLSWKLAQQNLKLNMNTFELVENDYLRHELFKNVKGYKYQAVLPFSIDDCVNTLTSFSQYKQWENTLFHSIEEEYLSYKDLLEKYSKEELKYERGNAFFEVYYKYPMFTNLRKSFESMSSFYDEKGNWIRIKKSMNVSDVKKNEQQTCYINSKFYDYYHSPFYSFLKFTRVSEYETQYTLINFHAFMGNTGDKNFSTYFVIQKSKDINKGFMKCLKKSIEEIKNEENDFYSKLKIDSKKPEIQRIVSLKNLKMSDIKEDNDEEISSSLLTSNAFVSPRSLKIKNLNEQRKKKGRSGSLESSLKSNFVMPTFRNKEKDPKSKSTSGSFLGNLLSPRNNQSVRKNSQPMASPRKEFDISKYYVKFSSVFKNSEFNNAFSNYLKNEYILEQFEFLIEVQRYNETNDKSEKLKIFFEIVELFILGGAKKELNLSGKTKNDFFELVGDQLNINNIWIIKNENLVFENLYGSISNEIQADSFPRFIRSPISEKLIEKYHKDNTLIELKEVHDFPYTDEHFQIEIVTDMDIVFMGKLMEEDYDWKLVYSNSKLQLNTYHLNKLYFPNVSFLSKSTVYKYEFILPYPLDICINAFNSMEREKEKSSMVVDYDLLSYLKPDELENQYPYEVNSHRANAQLVLTFKLPLYQKLRKSFGSVTSFLDTQGNYIRIIKPYVTEYITKSSDWDKVHKLEVIENGKKKVEEFKIIPNFVKYQLSKISECKTKLTNIFITQMLGSKDKFKKFAEQARSDEIHKEILDLIKSFVQEKRDDTKDPLYRLFHDSLEK